MLNLQCLFTFNCLTKIQIKTYKTNLLFVIIHFKTIRYYDSEFYVQQFQQLSR